MESSVIRKCVLQRWDLLDSWAPCQCEGHLLEHAVLTMTDTRESFKGLRFRVRGLGSQETEATMHARSEATLGSNERGKWC